MKSKVTPGNEHLRRRAKPSSRIPEVAPRSQGSLLDLKRILVPLDFSPTSLRTLRSVIPFARRFGADLFLLHVVERAESASLSGSGRALASDGQVQSVSEQLLTICQTEVAGLVPCEAQVRIGRPFLEIVAFARLHDIDLIIIGPYGESHLGQALLGSTAEKVVRHASCPVLALHEREQLLV